MRKRPLIVSIIALSMMLLFLFSTTSAFAATTAGKPKPPNDAGGGCSGAKNASYSGLSVSVKACISTNSSNVNADGYVSLNASNPSRWSDCQVGVLLYFASNPSSPLNSAWYNCFSGSPSNFSNKHFGVVSTPKIGGDNYFSIVELEGTYNGINVAVIQQSPNQCVGTFC